eukprot:CAMPEP_0172430764 /NCGR_PEP_ID=MMETSP1064-20121228/55952_1 /TAXON_ID=202472 /ORGANISM="Aulacoseira subarctica , Strain CCAP 1002/5" /LENGTH=220 /DNA_ID=CAMNT_0013177081 /DNA_START=119 /DNA_END=781 /DNA_ORIENTATION=+
MVAEVVVSNNDGSVESGGSSVKSNLTKKSVLSWISKASRKSTCSSKKSSSGIISAAVSTKKNEGRDLEETKIVEESTNTEILPDRDVVNEGELEGTAATLEGASPSTNAAIEESSETKWATILKSYEEEDEEVAKVCSGTIQNKTVDVYCVTPVNSTTAERVPSNPPEKDSAAVLGIIDGSMEGFKLGLNDAKKSLDSAYDGVHKSVVSFFDSNGKVWSL